MANVNRRGGFSDRNAIKPINTEIQLTSFDSRTRNQLVNAINKLYTCIYKNGKAYSKWNEIQIFIKFIKASVYSESVDYRRDYGEDSFFNTINNTILHDDYDDVLTVIEAIIQYWDEYLKNDLGFAYYDPYSKTYKQESVFEIMNKCFEREYVGYRFIGTIIMPISDSYEKNAIEETLANKYKLITDHISKANRLLSDRESPDYENSIKESISAVEAICEIMTGLKGNDATLGNMLKKLESNGLTIHGALKEAFLKLYGYTSNANGIRHAGDIGGPSSTFEEAKFMLVACCAFINYLMAVNADK